MFNTFQISANDRILIVAPHPDDETIGCGGIMCLYGKQCDVLLLTDGRLGKSEQSDQTEEKTAEIRSLEFQKVMEFFSIRSFIEAGIHDSKLQENKEKILKYDLKEYQYIFVPNRYERHPDHKAAYDFVKEMLKKQKSKAVLVEYEVWSPIIKPNRFLDISHLMDTKISGLTLYQSQLELIDYNQLAKGLGSYRGAPHHVDYCEAYLIEELETASLFRKLFLKMPPNLRTLLVKGKKRVRI